MTTTHHIIFRSLTAVFLLVLSNLKSQVPHLVKDLTPGFNSSTFGYFSEMPDHNRSNADDFRLYPNPANSSIKVECDIPITNLTIYDVSGKVCGFYTGCNQKGNRVSEVDISALPQGMYFIKIQTSGGSMTRKLIKN